MGKVTQILPGRASLFSAPAPLTSDHDVSTFTCGKPALDNWLKHTAFKNEAKYSRTYVVTDSGKVVAYYCLAAGSVTRDSVPTRLSRNAPNPVPVITLGRLAVHVDYQRAGLGDALLRDALRRTLAAAGEVGVAAVLVHPMDDDARAYYVNRGFRDFPPGGQTMFLPVSSIRAALGG